MLRIKTTHADAGLTIELCGQFTEEYVSELEAAIAREDSPAEKIRLDLGGVTFVDRAAMVFLCSASGKNIAVENLPSYVIRWMKQELHCGPSAERAPGPCSQEG